MHDEKAPSSPAGGAAIALPELVDEEAVKANAIVWRNTVAVTPHEFWNRSYKEGAESFEDAVEWWCDEENGGDTNHPIAQYERAALAAHLRHTVKIPLEPWNVVGLYEPGEFSIEGCAREMNGHVLGLAALAPRLLRLLERTLLGNDPEDEREAVELVMRLRHLLP